MTLFFRRCLLTLGTLAGGTLLSAQPVAMPGDDLEVYLMTMGQGDRIWERFGHNALGVRDRTRGTDIVYNWGTFSFEAPGFVARFVTGRMRYWVQAEDAAQTIELYRYLNRSVWIQELDLTREQRVAARDFVEWNAREENKFYQYDFFGDNCSTRVRDALDRVLGGALQRQFGQAPSGRTFRDETRRLTEGGFWAYAGVDLGLGPPADREMTHWEAMYVPGTLRDALRQVLVDVPSGTTRLVTRETQIFVAQRTPEPDRPAGNLARFAMIGLVLAGGLAALVLWGGRRGLAIARTSGAIWSVVAGSVGLVLILAWTATAHVWMYSNANILILSPLWWLVVPAVWRAGRTQSAFSRRIAMLLAALAGVGLLIAIPGSPQRIALVAAVVLPVQAVLFWMVLRPVSSWK